MSDVELTELLGRAAAAAPAPTSGPPDLGEEATEVEVDAEHAPRRRWVRPLAAAAAIAVALGVGSQVLDDADDGDTPVAGAPADSAELLEESPGPTFPASADDTGASVDRHALGDVATGSGTGTNAGAGAGGTGGAALGPAGTPAAQAAQPRIIHTGSIGIEVEEGAFAGTVERITSIATGFGGFVAATETAEQDGAPTGTITVRVPAASFEPLLAEVRRLGDVLTVSTSGQDVTAQYVDLEARLGALRATRDQFLAVLAEARAIGDILAVQDRINLVNLEIESLEGQRRLLEDQSGFGTLRVSVGEPGAERAVAVADERGDGGIGGAWDEARRGFGDAIEWFISRSGKGLVLVAVALAVLALGQLALRRLRRRAI